MRPTERAIIDALQIMPLAVAMFVEEDFYGYDRGLYDGCLVSVFSNIPLFLNKKFEIEKLTRRMRQICIDK